MTDQQKFILAVAKDAVIVLFMVISLYLTATGHQALNSDMLRVVSQTAQDCRGALKP